MIGWRSVLLILSLLLGGCVVSAQRAGTDTRETLRQRASFDLNCPIESLEVVAIDQVTRGVRGCGQRATYVWSGASQTWVMNTDGSRGR